MTASFKISLDQIWLLSLFPGYVGDYSGTAKICGDLRITVDGKDIPGVARNEDDPRHEASLNAWLRQLNNLRYTAAEDAILLQATGQSIGLQFRRNGDRLLLTVRDTIARRSMPGLARLVLSNQAVVNEVLKFQANLKRLLLAEMPEETAREWWSWHARSLDEVQDSWLNL